MQTMNQSLARLVERRVITRDVALATSSNRDELHDDSRARRRRAVAGALADGRRAAARRCRAGRPMTTYAWVGRTRDRPDRQGRARGRIEEALTEALRREQILVTKSQAGGRDEGRARSSASPPKSLAIFTRQFSVMIDAGLPLVQCLELLAKEEPDKRLAAGDRRRRAPTSKAGASLADAMRSGRTRSTRSTRNMVAAGEAGGILDTILKRLSTFIEKQAKLTRRCGRR